MKREDRYLVLKRKDLASAGLTVAETVAIESICVKIDAAREHRGADLLECVVVEKDWPEYDPTWCAIAVRMNPSKSPLQVKIDQYETYGSSETKWSN